MSSFRDSEDCASDALHLAQSAWSAVLPLVSSVESSLAHPTKTQATSVPTEEPSLSSTGSFHLAATYANNNVAGATTRPVLNTYPAQVEEEGVDPRLKCDSPVGEAEPLQHNGLVPPLSCVNMAEAGPCSEKQIVEREDGNVGAKDPVEEPVLPVTSGDRGEENSASPTVHSTTYRRDTRPADGCAALAPPAEVTESSLLPHRNSLTMHPPPPPPHSGQQNDTPVKTGTDASNETRATDVVPSGDTVENVESVENSSKGRGVDDNGFASPSSQLSIASDADLCDNDTLHASDSKVDPPTAARNSSSNKPFSDATGHSSSIDEPPSVAPTHLYMSPCEAAVHRLTMQYVLQLEAREAESRRAAALAQSRQLLLSIVSRRNGMGGHKR